MKHGQILLGGTSARPDTTRAKVCAVRNQFQGLVVVTRQYGTLPLFDPVIGWLANRADRQACYDAHKAVGDTHINLALSGQYKEGGEAYEFIPGRDYSQDLPALAALIGEAADEGLYTLLMLGGDGDHYDPDGLVHGYTWLMANFQRIYDGLKAVAPWTVFCPGYDGVVPAWQPASRVADWLLYARSVVGDTGHLAIELSAGYSSWGDGGDNWTSPAGLAVDTILQEFPYQLEGNWDQVWQICGRMERPYHRPANQPPWDDPNPPFYLSTPTPRGPRYYVAWEYDTYGWVRQAPLSQVQAHRAYLQSLTDNGLVG